MSRCTIDHSKEDIISKFEENKELFCANFHNKFMTFMEKEHTQEELNDLFHLFKKVDLLTPEELVERKSQIRAAIGLVDHNC